MGKPIVVAEIGLNHNGDMRIAKSLIGLAANLGADFCKFQVRRDVDALYTQEYLNTPVTDERMLKFGTTIREQRQSLEFSKDQYEEIDSYCKRVGIGWFASVWDVKAVEFMDQYDPPFIKIPSMALTHLDLLREASKYGTPLILSTGAATAEQIIAAYDCVNAAGGEVAYILHCTAEYPTRNDCMKMKALKWLGTSATISHWGCRVGFSNHCTDIIHIVQAAVMGASMVEFHITLDRNMDGPDHRASIGPMGFKRIMDHLDNIEKSWGSGKLEPSEEELAKGRHYLWRQTQS